MHTYTHTGNRKIDGRTDGRRDRRKGSYTDRKTGSQTDKKSGKHAYFCIYIHHIILVNVIQFLDSFIIIANWLYYFEAVHQYQQYFEYLINLFKSVLMLDTYPPVIIQKMKDFFSKCHQIPIFLRIWSNLLKKSLMEIFFCAVCATFNHAQPFFSNQNEVFPARLFSKCLILRSNELVVQMQPPEVFFKKRFPYTFRKVHRKKPVLESLFK